MGRWSCATEGLSGVLGTSPGAPCCGPESSISRQVAVEAGPSSSWLAGEPLQS